MLENQLFQYGFGSLKFALMLSKNSEFSCYISPNVTPGDGDCLIHGI